MSCVGPRLVVADVIVAFVAVVGVAPLSWRWRSRPGAAVAQSRCCRCTAAEGRTHLLCRAYLTAAADGCADFCMSRYDLNSLPIVVSVYWQLNSLRGIVDFVRLLGWFKICSMLEDLPGY